MNDLSMHILDIVQNSISAGATRVTLTVDEAPGADLLTIVIGDNGKGMTPEQVSRLSDPFFTSRTTRKVGMGIPLLMDSARQSGGDVRIESEPGKGTEVTAVFGYSYRYNGDEYLFDTVDVREILGDDALKDLTIIRNLEEMIKDNMREIRNC